MNYNKKEIQERAGVLKCHKENCKICAFFDSNNNKCYWGKL